MNQALLDTTPTRWEDQGRHNALCSASASRNQPTRPVDRPLGRKGEKSRRFKPPTPVFTERTQPSTDRETPAAQRPDRNRQRNPGAGRARSTSEDTARREAQQPDAAGERWLRFIQIQPRETHVTDTKKLTENPARPHDSSLARPAVTKLPGKCGRGRGDRRDFPSRGGQHGMLSALFQLSPVDAASARNPCPDPSTL